MREEVCSESTVVLCGLGVCPPIVLDQRLELDLQAIVLKIFFGQIAALPERATSGERPPISERITRLRRAAPDAALRAGAGVPDRG
jgi:hypothetical protein